MSCLSNIVAIKGFRDLSPELQTQLQNLAMQHDDFNMKQKALGNVEIFRWVEGYDENKFRQNQFYHEQMKALDQTIGNILRKAKLIG